MRQATVTLRNDAATALGVQEHVGLLREAGLVDLEVVSCKGRCGGILRVSLDGAIDEARLDELETVEWWERVSDSKAEHTYLLELSSPEEPNDPDADATDLPITEHVTVREEGFSFDLIGPQEVLGETLADYRDAGADVVLHSLTEYRTNHRPLDALTARQTEVLRAAYERGYYDVPRSASTEDVATELDLDTSTVSEHLQRAERNLLSTLLDRSR